MQHPNDTGSAHRRDDRSLGVGGFPAMATLAAILAVFLGACGDGGGRRETEARPAAASSEDLLAELQEQRQRIDQETAAMMKQIEAFNRSRGPGEPTLDLGDVFLEDLTGEEKDILDELIAEEKDGSYRTLLEEIVDEREKIRELQDRVLELEQTLPDSFVLAKAGDSHYRLAMDYLTATANLDDRRARELLAGVDQTEMLLPGNKVWFFYDPDRDFFRTYVTAGNAGRTPGVVRRAMTRQLVRERDASRQEAASLAAERIQLAEEITVLQGTREQLRRERSALQMEVADLVSSRRALQEDVAALGEELDHLQNTMSYHAATEKDLREDEVVTRFRKELKDVQGIDFDQELDLRRSRVIRLDAVGLGLERIREVRLLPSIYQEGRDYAIERSEDGRKASIVIQSPDLFRGREILLAVRGPEMERPEATTPVTAAR